MSRYIIKAYTEVEKKEFTDFIIHLKEDHGFTIWERPEEKETTYLLDNGTGILEEIAKEINNDIEQCKLWHQKLPKKECKECDEKCEYAKKEVNQH